MDLNYKLEGSGQVIVFIHGISDNLNYWEVITSTLRHNYTCLRFDLRGHGQTPLGDEKITVDLFTEDLHNLLNELNIKKVHLVGFSLGGEIALNFAIKYSSMSSSIILISSFAKISSHDEKILNKFYQKINKSFEEFYDFIIPKTLCPKVIEENKQSIEILREYSAMNANTEAIKKAILAAMDFDVWDSLGSIKIPSLILGGRYDEISLIKEQKELSTAINNSKLIIFENARHNLLIGENIVRIIDIFQNFYG